MAYQHSNSLPPKESPRRRWQFKLRSLFLLTTGIAFLMAFPKFALAAMCLFAATLTALALFVVVVQWPLNWLIRRFRRHGPQHSEGGQAG